VGIVQGKSVWPLVAKHMGLSESEAEKLRLEGHQNYQNIIRERNYFLLPNVSETVKALSERYPMAIVTSSHRENFDILHREKEILPYFRFILAREDFTHTKPHPEPYLMALEKMREFLPSLRADECLAIEDSERGVISAREAGMTVWAIPTDFTRGLDFSRADKILGGAKELPELLN
jgi:HAD superfamily hydrolase (TIGR01509 family)